MKRRPPRSTRTDNLFPYTTRFRSGIGLAVIFLQRAALCDQLHPRHAPAAARLHAVDVDHENLPRRSEEHTSELQSLIRISYAVFCLKKKNNHHSHHIYPSYLSLNYTSLFSNHSSFFLLTIQS